MKITISSLYFHPDHSGIAVYASDFAAYAAQQGHEVTVITGFPFYPRWKKNKADQWKFFRTDQALGAKVRRGYVYVPSKVTAFRRIVHELSFLLFATVNFLRGGRADAVVVFTTPVLLGCLAAVVKLIFRCPLVINVQDLQIEATRSLGMLKDSKMLRLMEVLEKKSYQKADVVSTISPGMMSVIAAKGVATEKQYIWPNWVDISEFENSTRGQFRGDYGIAESQKLFVYAGNIGEKQGLEVLLDLAKVRREDDDLQFLIVGAGAGLAALKTKAKGMDLPNLRFLPLLPPDQYRQLLADADAVFLSQKRTEADIYFPSKLLGLMAASKLLFVAADDESELYKVTSEQQLGYASAYGDSDTLLSQLQEWLQNPERGNQFVGNARRWVDQFDRSVVLGNVLKKISSKG
jgi:colanic acid biosynthesis glycosyl transferase WcaI